MGSRFVGRLILAIMAGMGWVYYLAPRRLRRWAGNGFGRLLRWAGFRAKVVEGNLQLAYSHQDDLRREVGSGSYAHLGNLILEILMLFGPLKRFCRREAELVGLDNWLAARKKGKGVILLANHVGNWEVMAATGARYGIDILLVTKHLKPEWLHQAVERARRACGVRATYEPKTLKDVMGHIRKGGSVGIVLDQYAGPPVGVRVPFFGVPVGTHTVVAMLANRTGAPVLPAVNYRLPDGRFRVEIEPEAPWVSDPDPHRELAINTAAYCRIQEGQIRSHPEQWLWVHRRFKGDLSPLRSEEWGAGRPRR